MEVDKTSFQPLLPVILTAIAKAHFVSIDLELSGIHKQPYMPAQTTPAADGRQTLQHRYQETKTAAEKYQVLQLGLTCVEQDLDRGVYVARPYNFDVSPLIGEKLELERDFTFQSGAVEFLLRNGFHLDAPFLKGVPYLSRKEEALARQRAAERQSRSAIPDILLRRDDVEALRFVERVRREISAWKAQGTSDPDYLNISSEGSKIDPDNDPGLDRFQKRLVHQIVRADFPDYVSISRFNFIHITPFDKVREDRIARGKDKRLSEQLSRQIGLRWVVEALVGGDLSGIDPRNFARSKTGEPVFVDIDAITTQFSQIQSSLKDRNTVLVGHNLLTDLINLYRVFFGDLPDRVEEFQRVIHKLFPLVIDTKYMFTHQCGPSIPQSSLMDVEHSLDKQPLPLFGTGPGPLTIVHLANHVEETHPEHRKYLETTAAHEAGYDSFLTAKVMVRLAAKLAPPESLHHDLFEDEAEEEEYHSAEEDMYELSQGVILPDKPNLGLGDRIGAEASKIDSTGGVSLIASENRRPQKPSSLISDRSLLLKINKKSRNKTVLPKSSSPFVGAGRFDSLINIGLDEDDAADNAETLGDEDTSAELCFPSGLLIPAFNHPFWKIYGNKLRVFGTSETVMDLATA